MASDEGNLRESLHRPAHRTNPEKSHCVRPNSCLFKLLRPETSLTGKGKSRGPSVELLSSTLEPPPEVLKLSGMDILSWGIMPSEKVCR